MLSAVGISAVRGRDTTVLDQVSLDIPAGSIIGVDGPSGSGKSTLVRVLALLHRPSRGHLTLEGARVEGSRFAVPAHLRRRLGVVFQHPRQAVDPRLTLREVIAEPLRAARRPQVAGRVSELADLMRLDARLLDSRPGQVSDGQLQRAALARAVALDPAYLLLDEPTSMLDAASTAWLVHLVKDYRDRAGAGVLTVSHDRRLLDLWCDQVHTLHAAPSGGLLPDARHRSRVGDNVLHEA